MIQRSAKKQGRRLLQNILFIAMLAVPVIKGHAQNLLVKGSFETPFVTNATKVDYPAPTNMWPWQTTATNFEVWTNGWDNPKAGTGPLYSADGGQNLEILSTTDNATVWQTTPTVVGERYTFGFYYTPRPGISPDQFTVSINSNKILSLVEDGSGLTNFDWQRFTTNFMAAGNLTALSFSDVSLSGGGAGTHIDGVVLEHLPFLTIQNAAGAGPYVDWVGVSNETYQLESSTNLVAGGWNNLGPPVSGNGTTNSYPMTPIPGVPQVFYRLVTGP
jgi:hypothetical protein